MADKKKTTRTWDSYVKEAQQPPFVLEVDDETTITIEAPTGDQVIEGERLYREGGSLVDSLRAVCGDSADDVIALVRQAPAGAMNQLMIDLMDHFGMAEALQGEASSRT